MWRLSLCASRSSSVQRVTVCAFRLRARLARAVCGVRVARSLRCCTCGVCASVGRLARAPHGAKICVLEHVQTFENTCNVSAFAAFNSLAYLLASCPWLVPHFAAYWMHTAARCFLLPLFITDGGGLLCTRYFFCGLVGLYHRLTSICKRRGVCNVFAVARSFRRV